MLARLLHRPWIALVVAMIVHAALFMAMQRDVPVTDPLWYAGKAYQLGFHPADLFAAHDNYPFVMRLGLTGPLALIYWLFGVSTFTTNLPSLLAGLAILAIAYAAPSTPRAKLLAVAFAMVCTPLIVDGRELNPDLPCAAVMAASLLCLARRDRRRGAWWVVAAVVAWFAAFQIKEVAVWSTPVWLYAALGDLHAHGGRWVVRRFAPALAVGAALAAGYLVFCAALWGDPLARFHGIADAVPTHEWSLLGRPAAEWIARLTWQPPVLLFRMFRVALALIVVSPWLVARRDRLWLVAAAACIGFYWFGSSTADRYLPLPIWRRMLLPALPAIVVVSALACDAAIDRLRAGWRIVLAAVLVVFLALPHVRAVARTIAASEQPERAAYAALRAEVERTRERVVLVCGEPRCPMITAFHFGFAPPGNLTVVNADEFAAAPLPAHARVRLVTQMIRARGAAREPARLAEELGLPRITWHPEVRLYDAGDGASLHEGLALFRASPSPLPSVRPSLR